MRNRLTGSNRVAICVILISILLISMPNMAYAKPIIKAFFNGQEATVSNVTLKIDEPFNIDVNITPDVDSTIYVIMVEPGIDQAYNKISGDTKGMPIKRKCKRNETQHFNWVLAANGQWVDGTAPVNIVYKIYDDPEDPHKQYEPHEFTVVNAYISRDHYTATSSKKTLGSSNTQAPKQSIGPEITPIGLLAAFLITRRRL